MKHRYPSETQRRKAANERKLVKENIANKQAIEAAIELLTQHKPDAALERLRAAS